MLRCEHADSGVKKAAKCARAGYACGERVMASDVVVWSWCIPLKARLEAILGELSATPKEY